MTDATGPGGFDSIADYLAIPRLTALALSIDGGTLVAAVERQGPDKAKQATSLWRLDPEGASAPVRLTHPRRGDGSPRFAPNGDLLFTSKRPDPGSSDTADADKPALWALPAIGGEPRRIGTRPGGIGSYVVARAEGSIVALSPTLPGTSTADEDDKARSARKDLDVAAILYEDNPVRHWDRDLGPDQPRLVVAAAPGADTEVSWRDLTADPGRALDEAEVAVTDDGTTAYVSWGIKDAPGLAAYRIVAVDLASGERRTVAEQPGASFDLPAVSPDGSRVACLRMDFGDPGRAVHQSLWLIDVATGTGRAVAPTWDGWPTSVRFTADGSALVVTGDENGRAPIFRVDLGSAADGAGDVVTRLAAGAHFSNVCVHPDGQTLFALRDRIDEAPVAVRLSSTGVDQPGEPLPGFPAAAVPGTVEDVATVVADGTTVRGWLVLPSGTSASTPAPLLLWVHGGPVSSWNAWSWRWNPWLLAARGYAVLLPDPAFSTGYGQAMIQRGWGQWGGAPYDDVMALTDVVEARPDIDETRTAMMGGSYGGYMANWIAGHTDRFKAIVTHASLWALDQFGPSTDGPAYWELEFGRPEQDIQRWLEWSPHLHVDNIRTPMLVIHGDKDYRVPIGEALRLWWDLQKRGVPSAYLYFPDENHWVLSPGGATAWYETVWAWLDHHVLGKDWQRPALLH